MPLADFARYTVGLTPPGDVAAQTRCLEYLSQTVSRLHKALSTDDGSNSLLRSEYSTLSSVESILKEWAGAHYWKTATKFWHYWDKNKRTIIAVHIGNRDEEQYLTEVGKLEDGRYYND